MDQFLLGFSLFFLFFSLLFFSLLLSLSLLGLGFLCFLTFLGLLSNLNFLLGSHQIIWLEVVVVKAHLCALRVELDGVSNQINLVFVLSLTTRTYTFEDLGANRLLLGGSFT